MVVDNSGPTVEQRYQRYIREYETRGVVVSTTLEEYKKIQKTSED